MTYPNVFCYRSNTSLFYLCWVILFHHICRHLLGGQNYWLSMQRSFCLFILLIWIQHLKHSRRTPGTASHFSNCWITPSEMTVRSFFFFFFCCVHKIFPMYPHPRNVFLINIILKISISAHVYNIYILVLHFLEFGYFLFIHAPSLFWRPFNITNFALF